MCGSGEAFAICVVRKVDGPFHKVLKGHGGVGWRRFLVDSRLCIPARLLEQRLNEDVRL